MSSQLVLPTPAAQIRTAALRMAVFAALAGSAACASRRAAPAVAPLPAAAVSASIDSAQGPSASSPQVASSPARNACPGCGTVPMPPDLAAALETRVAQLKARGGDCAAYGVVLEEALVSGRIVIKPYMWRVRGNLASAEGESSGEMTLARDIDSLNVGVRTLDDVIRSAEHEAVHIAMRIASGDEAREARVQERVRECSPPSHSH